MRGEQKEFSLKAKLVRMVLRVSPDLEVELEELYERLLVETTLEYSYAAILRGLIALGLLSLRDKKSIAADFSGVRIARGRKRQV